MSELIFSTKEYYECFENSYEALAHCMRQARELEKENAELKDKFRYADTGVCNAELQEESWCAATGV